MNIAGRGIGKVHPVFVVAELSANHNASLALARMLVHAAADAGADAVKFQVYRPDELTCDSRHLSYFMYTGPWRGRRLWDLYAQAQTPRDWIAPLGELASSLGLVWFASVFSPDGIAFLESLRCAAYKIASAEVTDLDLVKAATATGKPVILSDGMATAAQLADAVRAVPADRLAVLRCVSEYPARPESYRLSLVRELAQMGVTVGVSDHTVGITVPVAAVALGARIVEKHLMLDAHAYVHPPLDGGHSVEPATFREMVRAIRLAEAAVFQPPTLGASPDAGSPWRRRLVFACELPLGAIVQPEHLRTARCGEGIEPDEYGQAVGRVLTMHVQAGDPVTEAIFDPVLRSLLNAPLDDEPETEEERQAIEEALREPATIPHEEIKRALGL